MEKKDKDRKKLENSLEELNNVLALSEKNLVESINKLSFIKANDFQSNREIKARIEFVCRALYGAAQYVRKNRLNNSMLDK